MLKINRAKIVGESGQEVRLRGVCLGGWMNMESFINGFPGTESGLRRVMAEVLGPSKAQFFFERWLDYMVAEEDIALIASLGANVVRLPLNYRHFETDQDPYHYLESGFSRLDQVLGWCAKYGIYAILDMHAAQGWQNPDWHSDNPTQNALFWSHLGFQERYIALWQEIARRYQGNSTVAGYDLLNEPLTNELSNQVYGEFHPTWEAINSIYRRVIKAIRAVDQDHILFLEGDGFASRFAGLDMPFDDNLAYSCHYYDRPCWGPGDYPGTHREGYWNRDKISQVFQEKEWSNFTQRHQVPLYVGEFGSVFNGRPEELGDRLRGMEDTISVFESAGVHWTAWTYKDLGVMGWVHADPESEFHQVLKPVLSAKSNLVTDTWMYWLPKPAAHQHLISLAQLLSDQCPDLGMDLAHIQGQLAKAALAGTAGRLLQVPFARAFEKMSETQMDRVLSSFALQSCKKNEGLLRVVKKYLQPAREQV